MMKTSINSLYYSDTDRDKKKAPFGKRLFSFMSTQGICRCQNNLNLCSMRRELAPVLSTNDFICQLPLVYNCMSLTYMRFDSTLGSFLGS